MYDLLKIKCKEKMWSNLHWRTLNVHSLEQSTLHWFLSRVPLGTFTHCISSTVTRSSSVLEATRSPISGFLLTNEIVGLGFSSEKINEIS